MRNLLLQRKMQQEKFSQQEDTKNQKNVQDETTKKLKEAKEMEEKEAEEAKRKAAERKADEEIKKKEEEAKIEEEKKKNEAEKKRSVASIEVKNKFKGNYLLEWKCPKEKDHYLWNIGHDNRYLYVNCFQQGEIYRYSFDGKLISSLKYKARAMEIVKNQLYLLDNSQFFIVDIQTDSKIENWNLPKNVHGFYIKVDQEKIYFTDANLYHYVYLYSTKGKEINKFGSETKSVKKGEFNDPTGITVNEQYLYVCDRSNHRVEVINKENGAFCCEWKTGLKAFDYPRSILLYENLFYVSDTFRIHVFTKENECIDSFGNGKGSGQGECNGIRSVCIVNDKLYLVEYVNKRIQVWK